MRIVLFLILILQLSSCSKQSRGTEIIQKGFITESKTYYWGNKNIIVKDIEDDSKIFAITNEKNKIIYQQPINIVFSNYHYWTMYADENQNVYFYNSDYSESKALIWNAKQNKYDEKNFCSEKINLPAEFINELKDKNTLKNCKSVNQ